MVTGTDYKRRIVRVWRRRGQWAIVYIVVAGGVLSASGDSIVINNALHKNVIVKEDATEYVVLNPQDGTIVRAPKTHVSQDSIEISAPRERSELLSMFSRNQSIRLRQAQRTARPEPKVLSNLPKNERAGTRFDAFTTPSGVMTLTNKPAKYKSGKGQPVFKGKDGVGVLTNLVDKYRGNDAYIEFTIQYDTIHVPAKFRRATPSGSPPPAPSGELTEIVEYYASYYNLTPHLVMGVIRAESNFNPRAVSRAGARGLMQLMPGTAAEMGITNIFDPVQNVAGGTQYLSKMLALFNNDINLALAAYNAGPGNVQRYGGIPPFKETQDYVKRVQRYAKLYVRPGSGPLLALASEPGKTSERELPSDCFIFHLNNKLTEAAEGYVEKDDFYILQFEGRLTRVRKTDVKRIQEPA